VYTRLRFTGSSRQGPLPHNPRNRINLPIHFLHGWTTKLGGVKPTYLSTHGHEVINPSLPDDDIAEAVRIARAEMDRRHTDLVVSASRGEPVAVNVQAGTTPLVLLCPAWK